MGNGRCRKVHESIEGSLIGWEIRPYGPSIGYDGVKNEAIA
jgi:hypothetical protein